MTEAQFVAFQAAHPTAVFWGRCYAGQDPDINIRAFPRRRVPFGCGGRASGFLPIDIERGPLLLGLDLNRV
jgi:hypothetical protein